MRIAVNNAICMCEPLSLMVISTKIFLIGWLALFLALKDALYLLQSYNREKPLSNQIIRGIEREALRVDENAKLANTNHALALGAKLTHPFITTDYSENLLELITPTFNSIENLISFLSAQHVFVSQNLEKEMLWPLSMPCCLPNPNNIPIANYGTSNAAKLKMIYRKGLGHRYGKTMQTIAGVHYNISLDSNVWEVLHQSYAPKENFTDWKNNRSISLIRNFLRYEWLILYLFGSSPACCLSFDPNNSLKINTQYKNTLQGDYATSLRMSKIGYHNTTQDNLSVSYNSELGYIKDLYQATINKYDLYKQYDRQQHEQISDAILQIEDEYYSSIRPKNKSKDNERQLKALFNRGIEYLEIRALDVNPFNPIGINRETLYFLDCLFLFCLLKESPLFTSKEISQLKLNKAELALSGRKAGIKIIIADKEQDLLTAFQEIKSDLLAIAELLDQKYPNKPHEKAILNEENKLLNSELTNSAKINNKIKTANCSYQEFGAEIAKEYKQILQNKKLNQEFLAEQKQLVQLSLRKLEKLEAKKSIPFDEYLSNFLNMPEDFLNAFKTN